MSPAARSAASRAGALLGVLLGIYALAYLDRQVISLLVEPLRQDLKVSDVQVGNLQGAAFVLSYTLFGLPVGFLVDRLPRRAIICAGIVCWSLCSGAGGFADSYEHLLMARFGVGVGEAALLPAAYSMIADAFERARLSRAMAVFSCGSIVGSAVALGLGGLIADYATHSGGLVLPVIGAVRSWQLVFLITGALGLPAAFCVFLVREPPRGPALIRRGSLVGDRSHMIQHWRFYACHIAGFSLFCLLIAAATAWQPVFMQRTYGWSIGRVGFTLGAIHLGAGLVGMLAFGAIADLLQRRGHADGHFKIYLVALPLLTVAAFAAFGGRHVALSLAGLAFISAAAPFIAVAASALTLGTPAHLRGRMAALFLFIYNIVGFGSGPTLVAWLATKPAPLGGSLGVAMSSAFLLLAPLVWLLFWIGRAPMRRAVQAVQLASDGPDR